MEENGEIFIGFLFFFSVFFLLYIIVNCVRYLNYDLAELREEFDSARSAAQQQQKKVEETHSSIITDSSREVN